MKKEFLFYVISFHLFVCYFGDALEEIKHNKCKFKYKHPLPTLICGTYRKLSYS
jgi:hypothetical protein